MSVAESIELNALQHSIRYGLEPDNPRLLATYMNKADYQIEAETSLKAKRSVAKGVFQTLLNTISDTCVAPHWRHLCLDNIYKPMHAIERLSHSEGDRAELLKFRYELNTLGHYFL